MRYSKFILILVLLISVLVGCSSKKDLSLASKHTEFPDFVLSAPELVQETYVMASENPKVLASVPCFCGCYEGSGHKSNLDCFIKTMGAENAVVEWDPHGTA
ncbi:MAG: hypothetical protein K0S25_2192 [Bacillus sp. (in: firmicutes)]|nr:hypothetical protein [Bacillus sp. (in: firmicutes)]